MKTQTDCIYHCLACGRIERADLNAVPPVCCGRAMTQTCSETISNNDMLGANPPGLAENAASDKERPAKPR